VRIEFKERVLEAFEKIRVFLDATRPRVDWDPETYLSLCRDMNGLHIRGLSLSARCSADTTIHSMKGRVTTDFGRELPLWIVKGGDIYPLEKLRGVMPSTSFGLVSFFGDVDVKSHSSWSGLSRDQFRSAIGGVTISVEIDGAVTSREVPLSA